MKKAGSLKPKQIRDKHMALVKFESEADKAAIAEVRNYFSFDTNAAAVRFLVRRTADNIKAGTPLSILQR